MGISGQYVKTFREGNIASCTGISLDADYPHYFFDVIEADEKTVKLKSHHAGEEFTFDIHQVVGRLKGQEYAVIEQKSSFEKMLNRKPSQFKIIPMNGKRF
jgi:hypothetical protein